MADVAWFRKGYTFFFLDKNVEELKCYNKAIEINPKNIDALENNEKLAEKVELYTKRPVGRPRKNPVIKYVSFQYRAAAWGKERRIVAKIEHHQGELFPRIGYIVTSLKWPNKYEEDTLSLSCTRVIKKQRSQLRTNLIYGEVFSKSAKNYRS